MNTKLFLFSVLVALLAIILIGCDRDNGPIGDEMLFRRYGDIHWSIENAYNDGPFDLDNFTEARLMNKGALIGDSLYISRLADNQFLLTTEKSTRSNLRLTVDILNKGHWEDVNRDYYSVLLNGKGSYKISEDSLFTYELKDIGGSIIHGYPYYEFETEEWTYYMYSNGGEIVLTSIVNGKQTIFHYDLNKEHIYCRETGRLVLTYDD